MHLLAAALLPALLVAPPAPPPDVPARLMGAALVEGRALSRIADLTDTVGARLTGSPGAEAAVAWPVRTFGAEDLRPWTEPVVVPGRLRGYELG